MVDFGISAKKRSQLVRKLAFSFLELPVRMMTFTSRPLNSSGK